MVFLASVLWASLSVVAAAQAPAEPVVLTKPTAADFGALPFMVRPQLSPNGERVVARGSVEGRIVLVISSLSKTETKSLIRPIPAEHELEWYRWAGDNKLLVSVSRMTTFEGAEYRMTRLAILDLVSGKTSFAGPKTQGFDGDDLVYLDPDGAFLLLSTQKTIYDYPSVYRIDLATGESRLVVGQSENIWEWFADSSGTVRGGIGHLGQKWWMLYRSSADAGFRRTIVREGRDARAEFSAFEPLVGQDSGYAVATSPGGRFSLYRYDFKADALGELVYENPKFDIDTFETARDGVLRGVYYTDEHDVVEWFDPAMKKLQGRLDKALPGRVNRVISTDKARNRHIVFSATASDPGSYLLFDQSLGVMSLLVSPYAKLADKALVPVTPIRYAARDGLEIPGYLTLPAGRDPKALPLVIMPHGGPFVRDTLSYDPWVQYLASKGYVVLQPNYRGSTGFGRDYAERGTGAWGRGMQDDIDDGVKWLVGRGMVDPKRVCIMGASFGGYAAMWAAVRNPEIYRCAISFAGVSDVGSMLRFDAKLFAATRYFRDWRERVRGEKGFALDTISPIKAADRMTVPIMIAHGTNDTRVPLYQSRRLHEALTKSGRAHEYVVYEGEGHGFEKAENSIDFLERVGRFLDLHNPA